MRSPVPPPQVLSIILWLVMFHSFAVGIALIFMPASWLPFFGFEKFAPNFFQAQGGIFHIVMCVAYTMAAIDYKKYYSQVIFSISAKLIAFVFLLLYYLAINPVITILLSGIADGLIGVIIIIAYKNVNRY